MELKSKENVITQNVTDELEKGKYSERIYNEKLEFLKKIGLDPSKKPNFEKLSQYFQSEILNDLTFEITILLKQKKGLLEIITTESETKVYEVNESVTISFYTPNHIHFNFEIKVIPEEKSYELLINLKLNSDFDEASFRSTILGYEDVRNSKYNDEDEEQTFQEFDTLLPMEETIQIPMNTLLYLDVIDRDGNVETVLIKSRVE